MPTIARILFPLLVLGVFLSACGGDDAEDLVAGNDDTTTTADPDTAVSSPSQPGDSTDPTPITTWTRIEPTGDLIDPIVATPDELIPDPDDPNAVLVHFYGGVPECYGARTTIVEQSAEQVRIRLEVGGRPGAGDRACIEIAVAHELRVVLDAPLGDRPLVAVTT